MSNTPTLTGVVDGPALPHATAVAVFPSRAAWLAGRRRAAGPTSTEIAAILGLSPKRGPWTVYADRLGAPRLPSRSRVMVRGQRYEPRILEDYLADGHVARVVATSHVIVEGRGLYVSPDGFAVTRAGDWIGVEAKTDRTRFPWGRSCEIEAWSPRAAAIVREDYAAQCYACLEATGLPAWDLVVLRSLDDLRRYRLRADPDVQGRIRDTAVGWFRRHVEARVEPPYHGRGILEAAARLFGGRAAPGVRDPDDDERRILEELARLRDEERAIQARRDELRGELAARIGDGPAIATPEVVAALRAPKRRSRVNRARLRILHPEAWRDVVEVDDAAPALKISPRRARP